MLHMHDANPIGPAILAAINAGVGLRTLVNPDADANWAFGWNTFVVFAGCLIPMVWQGRNSLKFGFSIGLKNGLRFNFDTETCLNYPFLNILSMKPKSTIK